MGAGGGTAENTQSKLALPLHFRRARTIQVFTLLALLTAVTAIFESVPALGVDDSLRGPALGAAVGCLGASLLLYLFRATPEFVRIGLTMFAFGIPVGLVDMVVPRPAIAPIAVLAAAAALLLFLYEHGSRVELTEQGVVWIRGAPRPVRVTIAWGDIETVTSNLREIRTRFVGESLVDVESQAWFAICGGGKRIAFGTPRYRWLEAQIPSDPRWAGVFLSRAGRPAIARTLRLLRERGRVTLGPVEIAADGIAVQRLGRSTRMTFAQVRDLTLAKGFLLFDTENGRIRVAVRKVPNGVFLPEILSAVRGTVGA